MISESSVRACAKRGLNMILFHLTAPGEDVIDAIAAEGLKLGSDGWDFWSPEGDLAPEIIGDVVWLIDDLTFMQWEGILDSDSVSCSPLWRVVCSIPAQDPNLIRFRNVAPQERQD